MANNIHESNGHRKRVLVVDDDRFASRVLRIKLEQEGYQVFIANNGCEGMEQFIKHNPQVVITDLNMPKMDGWELCSQINQIPDAKPRIIITTSLIEHKEREKVKMFPNATLVDKPVSPKEICSLVQNCFQDSCRTGAQQ